MNSILMNLIVNSTKRDSCIFVLILHTFYFINYPSKATYALYSIRNYMVYTKKTGSNNFSNIHGGLQYLHIDVDKAGYIPYMLFCLYSPITFSCFLCLPRQSTIITSNHILEQTKR